MPSWLSGLLSGVNQSATANRADYQRREDEAFAFETGQLSKIAADESYTPEVRQRAATGLMELAANPGKRPKGGFLDRLLGTNQIQAHPAIAEVFRFMQGSETKGAGLPTGPVATKPAAVAPRPATQAPAAMPPTPAGQAGGGPPSPGALGGPQPTAGPAGGPPPPLNMGALGVNETTGAGPQGPPGAGVTVPRQIFRSPQEIETEKFSARYYGEIQGKVRGLVAAGVPEADARAAVLSEMVRARTGALGSVQSISGMMPDGRRQFGVLDKRPGSPTMGKYLHPDTGEPLIGFMPASSTAGKSFGVDREAIARARFGKNYGDLQQDQQAQVLDEEEQRIQSESYARGMGGAQADADAPLSTPQRMAEMNTMATRWQKEQAADRAARAAYTQMAIGLRRFQQGDKVGGSEAVRVGFEKLLDPSSVVREGEFNRQGMGLSVWQRMEGAWQQYFLGGGPIPDEVLAHMVETARQFAVAQTQYLPRLQQELQEKSQRHGIDPRDVMGASAGPGGGGPPPPAGIQGQGGPPGGLPPPIVADTPPGAPQRGDVVGQRYTGEVRMLPDGSFVGRINNQTVPLRKTAEGRFVY